MENSQLFDNRQKWLDLTKLQPKELIYTEIIKERVRQDEKWGQQNHEIINQNCLNTAVSETTAKFLCEQAVKNNTLCWGDIIIEEVAEALYAPNKKLMREELIQCAAVIVAMIESLDRNGK